MANTLLSYFKDNLKAQGESTKYLNRDFLAVYVHAYNERKKNIESGIYYEYGSREYEYNPVFNTRFYKDNSTAYCVFLELWHGYKAAMERLNDQSASREKYEKTATGVAWYLHNERECRHIAGY